MKAHSLFRVSSPYHQGSLPWQTKSTKLKLGKYGEYLINFVDETTTKEEGDRLSNIRVPQARLAGLDTSSLPMTRRMEDITDRLLKIFDLTFRTLPLESSKSFL
jgi:hypothetical protein